MSKESDNNSMAAGERRQNMEKVESLCLLALIVPVKGSLEEEDTYVKKVWKTLGVCLYSEYMDARLFGQKSLEYCT